MNSASFVLRPFQAQARKLLNTSSTSIRIHQSAMNDTKTIHESTHGNQSNFVITAAAQQEQNNNHSMPSTLIIFSGPTSLDTTDEDNKNELYLRNLDFFLAHGVDCESQGDTIVTLGPLVKVAYETRVQQINQNCLQRGPHYGRHRLHIVEREPTCYDMESMYKVLYNNTVAIDNNINISSYDFIVYINCGMTGPAPALSRGWTHHFTKHLSEHVLMTGLSINCDIAGPHVQSMAYAFNQAGLKIAKNAIFDCRTSNYGKRNKQMLSRMRRDIVTTYEIGMSTFILKGGGALLSIIPQWGITVSSIEEPTCHEWDPWYGEALNSTFGGRWPKLEELVFMKSSRFVTPELADLLNLTQPIRWNEMTPPFWNKTVLYTGRAGKEELVSDRI
jgi:hypothetical protein